MEAVIKSENALRVAGMKLLIEGLGSVNAERFIDCVKKDQFDYTEWQRDLWKDKTIEEIHQAAADFYTAKHEC
jgi:hypothetical protein